MTEGWGGGWAPQESVRRKEDPGIPEEGWREKSLLHWRRKWQPTLVLLPGESQGRGSLVGCCL